MQCLLLMITTYNLEIPVVSSIQCHLITNKACEQISNDSCSQRLINEKINLGPKAEGKKA